MKKELMLGGLLFVSANANAGLIFNNVITGADMSGIGVEVFFSSGASESATWFTTSTDASVPFGEGFAGKAETSGWSLSQQGYTEGNCADIACSTILGLWTLTNNTSDMITGFEITALDAGIVFDTEDGGESGPGRFFLSGDANPVASYSDPFYESGLFGTLSVDLAQSALAFGESLEFLADTDAFTEVPEPSSFALLGLGLLGFAGRRKASRS